MKRQRRLISNVSLFLMLVGIPLGVFQGCEKPRDAFRFSTGAEDGTYFEIGSDIADFLNNQIDDLKVLPMESTGGVQNLERLKSGEANLALASLDTVEKFIAENPNLPICELGVIYIAAVHFVIRNDKLKNGTLGDLHGVRFYPGAKGSGTEINTMRILGALGIQPDYVPSDQRTLGYADAAKALARGEFDATVLSGGPPIKAMVALMQAHGNRFTILNFNRAQQERAVAEINGLAPCVIPEAVYGLRQPKVTSVGNLNVLIMRYDRNEVRARRIRSELIAGLMLHGEGLRDSGYHPLLRRLKPSTFVRRDSLSDDLFRESAPL